MKYPCFGVYCPKTEDHAGHHDRLLIPFNDDALFVLCKEHDWMRVEFFHFGKQIHFKDIAIVLSEVDIPPGKKGLIFNLKKAPVYAKGEFKKRNRDFRSKGAKQ